MENIVTPNGTQPPAVQAGAPAPQKTDRGRGSQNPHRGLEDSVLDEASRFLAKHGPALGKLFLLCGSMAATIYNGFKAGQMDSVAVPALVTSIMILAGLVIEVGFAFAWHGKGSLHLVGEQRVISERLFNMCSAIMIGDLSLSVAEVAFGVGGIATFWMGLVQPAAAVVVIRMFYKIQGAHPEMKASLHIVNLEAELRASKVMDSAEEQRLLLAEKEHERSLQWASLRKRHAHSSKLVQGRWFNGQVRRQVQETVNKTYLPQVRQRLGKLPALLGLGKPNKN